MEWQPIETAPSEGMFLVYGTWDHEEAFYHGKPWWQFGFGFSKGITGEWADGQEPSHWMPLPAPPA